MMTTGKASEMKRHMKLIAAVAVGILTAGTTGLAQSGARNVCNKVPESPCLGVTLAGNGRGNVTSQPYGISCPSVCVATFLPYQGKITLTASTVPGSKFAGWTGGCLPRDSRVCVVSLTATTFVTARFEK